RDRPDECEIEPEPAEDASEAGGHPAAGAPDRPLEPPSSPPREPDRDEAQDGRNRNGPSRLGEPQVVPVGRDQGPDRDRGHGHEPEEQREACRAVARTGAVTTV